MERKSVIPKVAKEVLKKIKKRQDPDLPEFQPPSRGKARSFREVIRGREK